VPDRDAVHAFLMSKLQHKAAGSTLSLAIITDRHRDWRVGCYVAV